MADTIDRGLDGLTLSVSEEDQLRRQGDLVIKSFRALGDDHLITNVRPDYPDNRPNHQVDPLDHQTEYHPDPPDSKSSLDRFHWPNRFQLSQQITSLSESLDPSLLRSQPGPTLELILEILSGIRESLDQIKAAFHVRKIGLEKRIQDLALRNQQLFSNSEDLILHLKLSSDEPKFPDEPHWIRARIIHCTADSSEATQRLIEWIEGSELDIVQHGWMSYMRSIDSALVVELERFKLSDTQRELAEHILPILKLSRLLLKKLSKRGLSGEEGIGSYTELSSKQRTSLLEFGSKLHMITMSAKNLFDFIA
ncbi:uncharacterized protein PGTG_22253 [Puccinia graminis f. sp. tritici CRL 75-36-700-3]|uniref:Uncharacterized protein n=1 Tax=Puccinia graminis f. sp. tritici (strain CRL 75-36-700-3 / race SCCL) TaxID=418459 RepID=H6QU03_PUCGT|nr:uncharacterized protein PGTG_22253 [Puccinia graminis f. sp. tritici CRL 75-36-700-3]EHS64417.1 hypothetical protein PGTG_22253 [Puccinia graminis f. sp. tritici CRL 75-36-700-3]